VLEKIVMFANGSYG